MTEPTKQQTEALAKFRRLMGNSAGALAHFDRSAPELVRRLGEPPKLHPKDEREPASALVWDWFNAHYPGSPASTDAVLWSALTEKDGAVDKLAAALKAASAAPDQEQE